MYCPMKFNQYTKITLEECQCDKDQCAWWFKDTIPSTKPEGWCAIKSIAIDIENIRKNY